MQLSCNTKNNCFLLFINQNPKAYSQGDICLSWWYIFKNMKTNCTQCVWNYIKLVLPVFKLVTSHWHKLCSSFGWLIFLFIWSRVYSKAFARKIKHLLWPSDATLIKYFDDVVFVNNSYFYSYDISIPVSQISQIPQFLGHICFIFGLFARKRR